MCDTSDSDHDHSHEHSAGQHCCSLGEDYERNLAEQRKHQVTRRDVLRAVGASGLLIASGTINAGSVFAADTPAGAAEQPTRLYSPLGAGEFDGFYYLSGDHHIHTRYSSDAKYAVQRQVAEANHHGLGWMVITDHGSGAHNKISVDLTYPDIQQARDVFKNMLVFVGLEMNIPGAEHGTVMLEPNAQEKDQIKQFEAAYDGRIAPNTEEQAIAGLKFLDGYSPKPLFFANHPARNGLDSPHEIRNWKAAAPEIAVGFEGAPGHQAAGLIRDQDGKFVAYRGFYGNKPEATSWPGYPLESYFTYGGFDWMTAKLGGLWDSLLGDGMRWWITANSDSHKYFNDLQDVDNTQFDAQGYVSEVDKYFQRPTYGDFRPGEYSRTYVIADQATHAGVMEALRAGHSFVVLGDLIDRLKFVIATTDGHGQHAGDTTTAGMGDTLTVKPGGTVHVTMSVRVPATPNWFNQRPMVDHIDLIGGDVTHPSQTAGADTFTNPSTRVLATYSRGRWKTKESAEGLVLTMTYTLHNIQQDGYLRLRGTNTHDRSATPPMDPDMRGQTGTAQSPWDDLWFYSNPVFIRVVP
ncbi:MAG: PHP domain-containing protein [Herpetosiphonaceae bacterium]|nr:PHP domain-containing protein [Herpetosiphonaceae bacterium]